MGANPEDYPNNWRPRDFDPTPLPAPQENWAEGADDDPQADAARIKELPDTLFDIVVTERAKRGLF